MMKVGLYAYMMEMTKIGLYAYIYDKSRYMIKMHTYIIYHISDSSSIDVSQSLKDSLSRTLLYS